MDTKNVLSSGLARTLLHEVFEKELHLVDRRVLSLGNPGIRKLRCFLFDNGYLDKKDLKHFINKQLLAFGKRMYRVHTESMQEGRLITFPDHLISPHALGYAIKCGTVLPIFIRFDHGETAKEYMKKADGLLEEVLEQLLAPYVPEPSEKENTWLRPAEVCCAG